MNGAVRTAVKFSGDHKTSPSSLDLNGGIGVTPPYNSSHVLATRSSRQVLSYWTCSKLCAIFFVGGVVFGYTLRGRVKRWASKILKKLS
ncbi:uncharacterized protein LOC127138713 [Lathyrus oleraceus]|uniref:Uncharacterized protein n=1 Tax=Pisum sativum TaxID=3888 RepID=A0A9D5ANC9_PEA|nr:uncharacterized protein LOC127138713 [Pisum sativum]KAI5415328.1 hypothetical protein KIW84_040685 [Pisum sativum]